MRLKQLTYKFEDFFFSETVGVVLNFSKMLIVLFVISHWMACLFAVTGKVNENISTLNWINLEEIQDKNQFNVQYMTALYWSFMTMTTVGYGDVVPHSSPEKIVTILMMVVSCGIFAWIMGYFASVVAIKDANTKQIKDEIQRVNSFMIANHVP